MKNLILLSAAFGGLTLVGCSSAYRTAQTPDDVYFSEGPPAVETARSRSNNQPQEQVDGYASYWERQDDNMLRMKVDDRDRWNEVDDIDYWNGFNNNYWVNYNTGWNSPWMMNSWNHPMSWNNPWAWNSPMGWNTGFNNRWGWNSGWGMGLGWNSGWGMNFGMGWSSWNNCWNNPWAWNRPVTVINKYPLSTPARNSSALSPYSNATYQRPSTMGKMMNTRTVSPGTSRSIWESGNAGQGSNNNSMYRTINRSSNSGNNSSYDRPVRTFDSGGSGGGSRMSGGSMGGGSSSGGGSSRGGRGG